jgi:hypothetical protein
MGEPLTPLAERYGLHKDAMHRHFKMHVTDNFKRAAKIGPFESEEQLRRLVAESDTSVLENLRAIYRGLASRWLAALEAGADNQAVSLSRAMQDNLKLQARITREIAPANGPVTINTIVQSDSFRSAMLSLAREHPEVRGRVAEIVRMMAAEESRLLNVTPALEMADAD